MKSEDNLDFSTGEFWSVFIATAVLYWCAKIGLLPMPAGTEELNVAVFLIFLPYVFIIHVLYGSIRAVKYTSTFRIRLKSVVTGFFGAPFSAFLSLMACYIILGAIPHSNFTSTDDTTNKNQTIDESVYYSNCSHVRAQGADPLYKGDEGYRTTLDRDGDGVACE